MFFQAINQMMTSGVDITLSIRKNDGQLIVATLPRANGLKDDAQHIIPPITISGSAEELDAGYLEAIVQPMQRSTGLLTNMKLYEEQAELAAQNSRIEKDKKNLEAKLERERKEKYDKNFKNGEEQERDKKYSAAAECYKIAKTFSTEATLKITEEKITAMMRLMGQGSLFDVPTVTVAVSELQEPTQNHTTPIADTNVCRADEYIKYPDFPSDEEEESEDDSENNSNSNLF